MKLGKKRLFARTLGRRDFLRRAFFGAATIFVATATIGAGIDAPKFAFGVDESTFPANVSELPAAATTTSEVSALSKSAELPELPAGVSATFEKIENQPSIATITIDGTATRVEAFEPLERVPEPAREYVRAVWEKSGEIPAKRINVELDVSEAPEAADWAENAKSRLIYWYPKIVETLDGPEGVAKLSDETTIRLVFRPTDGVAFASGSTIVVSSRWIKRNPQDFGLVAHEATHVAQAYQNGEGWATEGIADYVRYYVSEPRATNRWQIDPNRSKYTDGYGVAATFFDWLIREKDPDFLKKLHRALRSRRRCADVCAAEYRTTPDALWDEFLSSLN